MNVKRIELVTPHNALVAFKNDDSGVWNDPHGGLFSDQEQSDMDKLAAGCSPNNFVLIRKRFNSVPVYLRVRVAF